MLDVKDYVEREKSRLREFMELRHISPTLAIVQAGNDQASNSYIAGKMKDCEELGIRCILYKIGTPTCTAEIETRVEQLSHSPSVNGVLLQLPVPKGIDKGSILCKLALSKDVDGLRVDSPYTSCTARGIVEYLRDVVGPPLAGLHVAVVGRSDLVGKPLTELLLKENATVTICHSYTLDLESALSSADIIVSAAGVPGLIKPEFIHPESVVIDVGTNRTPSGKLCGDVNPECYSVSKLITPVPGGVGLLTRLALLKNIVYGPEWRCC